MVTITKTKKELINAAWGLWESRKSWTPNSPGLDRFKTILKQMENDSINDIIFKMHDFIQGRPLHHFIQGRPLHQSGFSRDVLILLLETLDIKTPEHKVACLFFKSDSYDKKSFEETMNELDQKVAELRNPTITASI